MFNVRTMILLAGNIMVSICTHAQQPFNYFFHHIDQTNGLLHNDVLSVTQDTKGFIWLTTPNGLQRFDGVNFKNYPNVLKNKNDNSIYRAELFADKKNNVLWLGTDYTIEKMPFQKNVSVFYNGDNLLNNPDERVATYMAYNKKKWLLSDHVLYIYDSISKKNIPQQINIYPANYKHSSLLAADTVTNEIWASVWAQLYLFDKNTMQIYSHFNNPKDHPILRLLYKKERAGSLRYVMKDSRQNIWISTWGDTLYKYEYNSGKIKHYILSGLSKKNPTPPSPVLINCMIEDDHQIIWAATENAGLLRYNSETDNFDYCMVEQHTKQGIEYSYKLFSLFQDREENIWVGTDKGISIFNPYRQFFKTINHEEGSLESVTKNELTSFIQTTNGDIFLGTWGGGVAMYDSNYTFKRNIFFNSNAENNFVWSFVQADEKHLWIGCQLGYLQIYDLKTGNLKTLHPPEMEGKTIRCMQKDSEGNIWFGLNNGKMVEWSKAHNTFLKCGNGDLPVSDSKGPVNNILIDKNEQCWVSTANGFRLFDLHKKKFTETYIPQLKNNKSISSKICEGIEELDDSTLAVGTIFGGLNFYNKRSKTFSRLVDDGNLPLNNIHALKKDKDGFLWFTTDYNLYKLNLVTKKIIPYPIEKGVINTSFYGTNFYQLNDGQWLTFTLSETLNFLPLSEYKETTGNSKIEITGFSLFDKPLYIDTLLAKNQAVELSYKQNFFTIAYAALNFLNREQTNYFHKLSGVDKEWVNAGTTRVANYTDLKPGNYTFNVKGENAINTSDITSFQIVIKPPFWKTWWFIACSVLLIVSALYFFIRWRVKSVKTIEAEKLKVQKLEAERYKNKLEMEQIINFFSNSLVDKKTVDDVLWDVAKNLIGTIGFVDCIIYLWNDDKTKMVQKAGIGPKGSLEEIKKQPFDVSPGQGVVGYVMMHKVPVLIADTSKDDRYRPDEMVRLSEITVPIIYNNDLLGIVDSEHPQKDFYTAQHLQLLTTVATLVANKIKSLEAEQSLKQTRTEISDINEQLSKARLDALRSQMNPHFIFNCINSIDALIQSNDKYHATVYLNKFAKLLRNILDSSKQNTVTLSKDVDTLKLYIELEQLRHENKFTAEIVADDFLMQSDIKVPSLIIQPFVENAILHGIRCRTDNKGKLKVLITKKENFIEFVIEDNGVGRNFHVNENQNEKISYGTEMTNDRVKLFNKEETASIKITDLFEDNSPAGTRVTLVLKII
jgi:ligand-binding sensor domain-containing protein/putative methionine-R-sulfoxide reductase with GAF domain